MKEAEREDYQRLVAASSSLEVDLPRNPVVRDVNVSRHLPTPEAALPRLQVPPPPNNTPRAIEHSFLDAIDERFDLVGSLREKLEDSTLDASDDGRLVDMLHALPPTVSTYPQVSGTSRLDTELALRCIRRQNAGSEAGISADRLPPVGRGVQSAREYRSAPLAMTPCARTRRASATPRIAHSPLYKLSTPRAAAAETPPQSQHRSRAASTPPTQTSRRAMRTAMPTASPRQAPHTWPMDRTHYRGAGSTPPRGTPRTLSERSTPTHAVCL